MSGERDVSELIIKTWQLVDFCEWRLNDPEVEESEKIKWAGVLATAIGTLNKLLWKAGLGRMDKEDLAMLLSKIPKKYQVLKVYRKWKRQLEG